METLLYAACFFGALAAMEAVAYFSHKYVMHGFLWVLHESHHRPRAGLFELNDWFAVYFATPSIVMIYFGTNGYPALLWAGLGVAAYGVIYFGFHDIIVHRRINHQWRPGSRYMQRIVHAHRLHHASEQKEGAVSFGFVYAKPVPVLRARMKEIEAREAIRASASSSTA